MYPFCELFGHALKTYNQHKLAFQVTDTTNYTIGTTNMFIAVDLKGVHMVLGLPWLVQWNIAIHLHDQKWWFHEQTNVVTYTIYNMTNGQIVSIPKPGQIIDNVDNYTQYEHPSNSQPIGYVKKEQVGGMAGQSRDIIVVDGRELEDFELDMEVGET